jgi:hypothetical protein
MIYVKVPIYVDVDISGLLEMGMVELHVVELFLIGWPINCCSSKLSLFVLMMNLHFVTLPIWPSHWLKVWIVVESGMVILSVWLIVETTISMWINPTHSTKIISMISGSCSSMILISTIAKTTSISIASKLNSIKAHVHWRESIRIILLLLLTMTLHLIWICYRPFVLIALSLVKRSLF